MPQIKFEFRLVFYDIQEAENHPWLKNFNLKTSLTCNIYKYLYGTKYYIGNIKVTAAQYLLH